MYPPILRAKITLHFFVKALLLQGHAHETRGLNISESNFRKPVPTFRANAFGAILPRLRVGQKLLY